MIRLNSGNFRIKRHNSHLYRVKSALKIIENDTDIAYEIEDFPTKNRLLNFCGGEIVGGKSRTFRQYFQKSGNST